MSLSLLLMRFCAPAASNRSSLFSLVHRVFLVAPLGDEIEANNVRWLKRRIGEVGH